jgi:hypothetical protein
MWRVNMSNWRDLILDKIMVGDGNVIIVCDPDGLLQEEDLLASIRKQGYNIVLYDDPVAFRYLYESEYRVKWDRGEKTETRILLLHILQKGSVISINIHQIFPKLSYPIVETLEKRYFEKLYAEYEKYEGGILGDNATIEFILDEVFNIYPFIIDTDKDLFKMFFQIHCKKMDIPKVLVEYLIDRLKTELSLKKWDLKTLFDREKFLQFIQEKWHEFLIALSSGKKIEIPFEEKEIRGYIEDLFLEGELTPVEIPEYKNLPQWTRIGIAIDSSKAVIVHLKKLLAKLEEKLEKASKYQDWQEIGKLWAESLYFRYKLGLEIPKELGHFTEIHRKIESLFKTWLLTNFGNLYSLPYRPIPIMVHHIPHYIASEKKEKIALIVVDGLALDQWRIIHNELNKFSLEEHVVYSWVPTLTYISRRSLFSGDPPHYFATISLNTNDEPHWVKFWQNRNYSADEIFYKRGIKLTDRKEVNEIIKNTKMKILGLVINTVDDFMHNAQMGILGMHERVKLWAKEGYLDLLIEELLDRDFTVYISSDHGNVSATGEGTPQEGVLVERKGHRARVYSEPHFLKRTAQEFQSVEWPEEYFAPGYLVLLADGLSAFSRKGEQVIAHGGISLEEVLVPFIQVRRGD